MRKRLYEGPRNWSSNHTALALAATKPAQLDTTELQFRLERALGIGAARAQALIRTEAARYLHMVYVRARPAIADKALPRVQAAGVERAASRIHAAGDDDNRGSSFITVDPTPALIEALEKASGAASPDGTVLVLYTNGGFTQLAQNALCSLRRFRLLARSLVLAHNPATCASLRAGTTAANAPFADTRTDASTMPLRATDAPARYLNEVFCVALPPPRKHGGDHGGARPQGGAEKGGRSRALTAARGVTRWGSAAYR